MSTNKERILRDLEYLGGGIATLKAATNKEKQTQYYELLDDWLDTLYSVIDMIEEDYENAAYH